MGNHRVEGLRFTDGTEVKADLVVMAVGVRPNIGLAKKSGIHTNRAILVNDYLETNIPDIYAVGECVEHQGMVYGLVKPLYEQGKVLAKQYVAKKVRPIKVPFFLPIKISGVDIFQLVNLLVMKAQKSFPSMMRSGEFIKEWSFKKTK